jgi:hypothetical protein
MGAMLFEHLPHDLAFLDEDLAARPVPGGDRYCRCPTLTSRPRSDAMPSAGTMQLR